MVLQALDFKKKKKKKKALICAIGQALKTITEATSASVPSCTLDQI
jgi:hypothetical protein